MKGPIMISCLSVDGIKFADKRNRTILKKMLTAAESGLTEDVLFKMLLDQKTSPTKLPFDISRILQMLSQKTSNIVATIDQLSKEAKLINSIGIAMSKYVKVSIADQESIQDEYTKVSWRNEKKLVISDVKQSVKSSQKPIKSKRK